MTAAARFLVDAVVSHDEGAKAGLLDPRNLEKIATEWRRSEL